MFEASKLFKLGKVLIGGFEQHLLDAEEKGMESL